MDGSIAGAAPVSLDSGRPRRGDVAYSRDRAAPDALQNFLNDLFNLKDRALGSGTSTVSPGVELLQQGSRRR